MGNVELVTELEFSGSTQFKNIHIIVSSFWGHCRDLKQNMIILPFSGIRGNTYSEAHIWRHIFGGTYLEAHIWKHNLWLFVVQLY